MLRKEWRRERRMGKIDGGKGEEEGDKKLERKVSRGVEGSNIEERRLTDNAWRQKGGEWSGDDGGMKGIEEEGRERGERGYRKNVSRVTCTE